MKPITYRDTAGIKSCPFCGSTHVAVGEGTGYRRIMASCVECGASSCDVKWDVADPGGLAKAEKEAIEIWNTRLDCGSKKQ